MSGSFATQIGTNSPLTARLYSVATFAAIMAEPGFVRTLIGPNVSDADALRKIKGKTDPGMPIVRNTDLARTAGDKVTIDLFDTIRGKPLIGDANAEGTGAALSSSTMEIRIDLLTKMFDAGGRMTRKRTRHELREIAKAQAQSYFPALADQTAIVQLAGARGTEFNDDWIIPLDTDPDINGILINPFKAPSFNRHFVVNNNELLQGGANLATIEPTDILSLEHLARIKTLIDERTVRLQSVRLAGDKMQGASHLWLLYVTPRQYELMRQSAGGRIETLQANALKRASFAGQHPVFMSESFLFEGILVNKLPYNIRFRGEDETRIVTSANAMTGTESIVAVNEDIDSGYAVDRAILLGAQALGDCFGRLTDPSSPDGGVDANAYPFGFLENPYNIKRATEYGGEMMRGMAKIQFKYNGVPTDHGVCVIDSAVSMA